MTRPLQAIGAAILAVALLLLVGDRADSTTRRPRQRTIDAIAEAEYALPRGILARHRRYERAGRRCLDRPWNGGRGQVCGRHQVLVWDRTSRDGKRLGRVVKSRLGAAAAAALLLSESRAWCAAHPGECLCFWERLNRGDRSRLCARLEPDKYGGTS